MRTAAELLRENVRYWLHERRMSKSELSRAVKATPSWTTGLLKGRHGVTMDKLDPLAAAFQVPVSALFVDRDQSRQSRVVEGLRPIFQGAPDDPSEREAYYQAVIQAFTNITRAGIDVAAAAVKEAESPRQRAADDAARARHRARPHARKAATK